MVVYACGAIFLALLPYAFGHECYVCSNQTTNRDKCVKTVEICEYEENACLTNIGWGSPPYWQLGVKMIKTISKRCATQRECERRVAESMETCTYVEYEDWRCSSCCLGNRCNYYIIDDGVSHKARVGVLLSCAALLALLVA